MLNSKANLFFFILLAGISAALVTIGATNYSDCDKMSRCAIVSGSIGIFTSLLVIMSYLKWFNFGKFLNYIVVFLLLSGGVFSVLDIVRSSDRQECTKEKQTNVKNLAISNAAIFISMLFILLIVMVYKK